MFGSIGFPELMLIFIIALLLFGPRKLPDIGRSLGKALGEFRRASNDLKRTLEEEVHAEDLRDVHRELKSAVDLDAPAIATVPSAPPAVSEVPVAKVEPKPEAPPKENPPTSLEPR